MKKLFQNKSLLKLIQIFLVCLVVLWGGFLDVEDIKADATDCTATIDIVFYIDTSGSMSTEWDTVCDEDINGKNNIDKIIEGLELAGNTVNYKVYGLEITKNCATDSIAVDSESWGPATSWVANNYLWTPGAIRIAVPMGDECPHKGNSCTGADTNSITQAIADANNNNVIVSPIISVGGTPYTHGANLANGTGGTISGASTPAAIVTAITDLITNEIGDQDGDGYLSVECGGDDCDDSEASIYAGQPCFDKCFDDVLKRGICQAGTGECIYDSVIMVCEEMGDPCRLDKCVEVNGGDDVCSADGGPNLCGGLIPCGRIVDDCDTDWDERADCNLCHFIIMGKLIIDFLLKIAVTVGALFVALGGILYIFAAGDTGKMALAKGTISRCLLGFAIIFVGWIMVNTVMVVFGYVDLLDSGGKWHKITCNVPMRDCAAVPVPPPAVKICGDGNVDTPNDAGFFEECDTDGSSCGSLVCNADCTCKTEPTPGVCGVWFSDAILGAGTYEEPFSPESIHANWVGAGSYSDNAIAFPNAAGLCNTFDGIAIDSNTHLELWDGAGVKVIDVDVSATKNPTIINNPLPVIIGGQPTCWGLDITRWPNCQLYAGDMNSLSSGSCKITCVAPEE